MRLGGRLSWELFHASCLQECLCRQVHTELVRQLAPDVAAVGDKLLPLDVERDDDVQECEGVVGAGLGVQALCLGQDHLHLLLLASFGVSPILARYDLEHRQHHKVLLRLWPGALYDAPALLGKQATALCLLTPLNDGK